MNNKIYYSILFVGFCQIICAQSFVSKIKVEYKMSTLFTGNYQDYKATLYANEDVSRFEYAIVDKNQDEDVALITSDNNNYEFNFKVKDTSQNVIFMKKTEGKLYSVVPSKEQKLAIYEELPKIDWKLTTEEKKIGNIACKKATAFFRGRNYIVWYTEAIPVTVGPWKLNGLPGLILEATDKTGEVYFSTVKVVVPFKAEVAYLQSGMKMVDRAESQKIVEAKMAEMKKKLQSVGSRGVNVKVGEMKVNNGIELE